MRDRNELHKKAMDMLWKTSRTFYIPIRRLPPVLQEAVASAYLCMRAIDEIEDHPQLTKERKVQLLHSISEILKKPIDDFAFTEIFQPHVSILKDVTLEFADWIRFCPSSILSTILSATARMAKGMAEWVSKDWEIRTVEDLDHYTFNVAGLVGVMLSDLWKWHASLETNRELAIAFGRGLQAVNIIRNRKEDLARGVNFFPNGWERTDMFRYARKNLSLASVYIKDIKPGPILDFCKLPLVFAYSSLLVMEKGEEKLSRGAVQELTKEVLANDVELQRYEELAWANSQIPQDQTIVNQRVLYE